MARLISDEPVNLELPANVQVQPTSTSVRIHFDPSNCTDTYGPIMYKVSLIDKDIFRNFLVDIKTDYEMHDLIPYTNYTIIIETARDKTGFGGSKGKNVLSFNFITEPGGE